MASKSVKQIKQAHKCNRRQTNHANKTHKTAKADNSTDIQTYANFRKKTEQKIQKDGLHSRVLNREQRTVEYNNKQPQSNYQKSATVKRSKKNNSQITKK